MGKHSRLESMKNRVALAYSEAEAMFQPYADVGFEALEHIKDEVFDVEAGELWKYIYGEGTKLIRQEAAARGLVKSGPGMEAQKEFTEEMGLQHINWKMGQWWNLTNMGTWATSSQANIKMAGVESQKGLYQWAEEMKKSGMESIMGATSNVAGAVTGMAMGGLTQPFQGTQISGSGGVPQASYQTSSGSGGGFYGGGYVPQPTAQPSYYR